MRNYRTVLKSAQIRKHNTFLKNWANRTKSDELYDLIMDSLIMGQSGKIVLKGTK